MLNGTEFRLSYPRILKGSQDIKHEAVPNVIHYLNVFERW